MPLDNEKPSSTLGDRLLTGVRSLWAEVHRHDKIIDHQGHEVEQLKSRVAALERKLRGVQVSRGRHRAKNAKLEAALAESVTKLADIKSVLDMSDDQPQRPN